MFSAKTISDRICGRIYIATFANIIHLNLNRPTKIAVCAPGLRSHIRVTARRFLCCHCSHEIRLKDYSERPVWSPIKTPSMHICLFSAVYTYKATLEYICTARLLARRASRRWDAHRTKNGRLWTPKFWGKREIILNFSLSIVIYLKRNSFNSHYYYTFDILINLIVYLAEWKCRS
jgi:hypothetical protein